MACCVMPWLLSERVSLCLENVQRARSRMRRLLFTFLTQVCSFLVISSGRLPRLRTEYIKFPESEPNAVNPNEKTTQLARKSFAGPPTQEQPQHPEPSSCEAHGSSPLQGATPAASSGRPASPQITDKRNPGPNDLQLPALLTAQAERDQQITQLTAKLAVKSALLEQAEANAAEAAKAAKDAGLELRERSDQLLMQTSQVKQGDIELKYMQARLSDTQARFSDTQARLSDTQARLSDTQAKLDELLLSRDQQTGQYEKELANMRAKLGSKESELESIRLRLTDAEKDSIKSKAEADTLRAQTAATGSGNRDEDQVTRRLMERMRAIEDEMTSKRWNEKRIEDMECRNEG